MFSSPRSSELAPAAGENADTVVQFDEMTRAGAAGFIQPSVTKVEVITEYQKMLKLNSETKLQTTPRSPYFGPGNRATRQMAAVDDAFQIVQYLYYRARGHSVL